MELKLGKMTNKELAEWFGINARSFSNQKAEKLEILKDYADFYEEKGKIIITKILVSEKYDKSKLNNQTKVKNAFDENWSNSGIDTCANVSEKIYEKYGEKMELELSTVYNYTLNARNELYGKPFVNFGEKGSCSYLWCKKECLESGEIILTPFTEEEEETKKKLMKKYFSTDEEKDILIKEMVENGEITKEEAYDLTCEYRGLNKKGFIAFKKELEEKLGANIVKGTVLNKNEIKLIGGDGR